MTSYRVIFTPEALAQLEELYATIVAVASPERAFHHVSQLLVLCASLGHFPHRGRKRDDVRPGLRAIYHRRRTVIVFRVKADDVTIIGVFHGGQDYETKLGQRDDDGF